MLRDGHGHVAPRVALHEYARGRVDTGCAVVGAGDVFVVLQDVAIEADLDALLADRGDSVRTHETHGTEGLCVFGDKNFIATRFFYFPQIFLAKGSKTAGSQIEKIFFLFFFWIRLFRLCLKRRSMDLHRFFFIATRCFLQIIRRIYAICVVCGWRDN